MGEADDADDEGGPWSGSGAGERIGETGTSDAELPNPDEKAQARKSPPLKLTDATKRVLPVVLPRVLVLHLKRLSMVRKITQHVVFPPVLDMRPFSTRRAGEGGEGSFLYQLFAVVEHSGGMGGGHYVASFHRPVAEDAHDDTPAAGRSGHWWFASDSVTSCKSEAQVLSSQAYILFYEQLPI